MVISGLGACESGSDDDGPQSVVGLPCDASGVPAVDGARVVSDAPECGGEAACVFMVPGGALQCSVDADCESGSCVDRTCAPSEAELEDHSMCAPTCELDAECETMNDSSCEGGFVCTHVASAGPDCCTKQCVCRDGVNLALADQIETACAAGVQEGCNR